MNTYTIYWLPEQQSAMMAALPFLNVELAEWVEDHFALVQELNSHQYDSSVEECQAERILGIKPGANPGGSPNGCA